MGRTLRIGQLAGPLAGGLGSGDNRRMKRRARRGQVVVEAAIIMPVFVFLILGLLQMGLMHQARVMTKYAAYKAVRTGALRRGEPDPMKRAALAVMLPMLGRASASGAPYRTDDVGGYNMAWASMKTGSQQCSGACREFVEVTVCNPTRNQANVKNDFDDPRKAMGQSKSASPPPPEDGETGAAPTADANFGWQGFNATKLQVQITTYYRMYIPFANWMVWRLAVGKEDGSPKKMRHLGWKADPNAPTASTLNSLMGAANNRIYIMPIRANYAMRMQSNFSQAGIGGLQGSNTCKKSWQ